jgi:ribosomal protein S12 methylthiotransferase
MEKTVLHASERSLLKPEKARAHGPARVFVISLGCPKNLIDTEYALGGLGDMFGGLNFCREPEDADIILVNTCSFIEDAVSESIETILEAAERKRPGQVLAVMGCLPFRYGNELKELLPEVDLFSFHQEPGESGRRIAEFYKRQNTPIKTARCADLQRIITGRPWQQYVKISEGCSNRCTYCLIPWIRGRLRCRRPGAITGEINRFYQTGVREITLVAQDLTAYETDGIDLASLLDLILRKTKVPWFRLMYLYPEGISEKLLRIIETSERICPYLDMPVQHASSSMLRAMGRTYDSSALEQTMEAIRQYLPDFSLRTTVMVGFPGETKEDFEILKAFIKKWRFHHLGCFTYSDEEDAPSFNLKNKVPMETAKRRKAEIMDIQADISAKLNSDFVGQILNVLVEGACEETDLLLCGRTGFQSPEIDGVTYINDGTASPGQIVPVRISESHTYDLVGKIVSA